MNIKYNERVVKFNEASGAKYVPEIRFITFRTTRKGILVGYTVGKKCEIDELRRNVANAGAPYYMK